MIMGLKGSIIYKFVAELEAKDRDEGFHSLVLGISSFSQ